MPATLDRRVFIGCVLAAAAAPSFGGEDPDELHPYISFAETMKDSQQTLRELRRAMKSLGTPEERDEAAALAQRIGLNMVLAVNAAQEVPVPARLRERYQESPEGFVRSLRAHLIDTAVAALTLAQTLWRGDGDAAPALFDTLRTLQSEGHREFREN